MDGRIDPETLHQCAQALLGRHDFTAFTPTETEHSRFVRDVRARSGDDGELLEFWIEADTFLRHMNRVLVGSMLDVRAGLIAIEQFMRAARGAPRVAAGSTAPRTGWRWRGDPPQALSEPRRGYFHDIPRP